MEPEQLKVIAEGVGYGCYLTVCDRVLITHDYRKSDGMLPQNEEYDYSPLTNAEQRWELQIILMELGWDFGKDGNEYTACTPTVDDIIVLRNKVLEELICSTAFGYFNEVNNGQD